MTRSKIFMAVGALLLTIAGIATTKGHSGKRFWSPTAKFKSGGLTYTLFSGAGFSMLTAGPGNGRTARIFTVFGNRTLLTAGAVNKLHFTL